MSNHWRFECLSHNPSIMSEHICSHTGNTDYHQHIALVHLRPLDMNKDDIIARGYWNPYERNAHIFLIQHENCDIGLVDEYGVHKTLDEVNPTKKEFPAILMCVACIDDKNTVEVLPAVTMRKGDALCVEHFSMTINLNLA